MSVIFVEKLFFEHFVLKPCTCNTFAPCALTVGLYKHAQVLNAQIFRVTTKHYIRFKVKVFVKARIILVGAILTEL